MKVLIVGYGSIARKHHAALLQIDPSIEVFVLHSRDSNNTVENVCKLYNYNEVQNNQPYDFIIISNPTYKHIETIENLLYLKSPLFIEKPLSDTLECKNLVNKIGQSGIITYVACNLRFLDSLVYLKEHLLRKLKVNEVNVYCGSYLPEWRPGTDYRLSYSANAPEGGGVHLDLIHELDYTYWLFGIPASVRSFRSCKSSLGINATDYANYLLEYDKFAANISLNYFRKDSKRKLELVCDDDTYVIDILENSITKGQNIIFQSEQKIIDTYVKQLEYFVENAVLKQNRAYIMNNVGEAFEVLKLSLQ